MSRGCFIVVPALLLLYCCSSKAPSPPPASEASGSSAHEPAVVPTAKTIDLETVKALILERAPGFLSGEFRQTDLGAFQRQQRALSGFTFSDRKTRRLEEGFEMVFAGATLLFTIEDASILTVTERGAGSGPRAYAHFHVTYGRLDPLRQAPDEQWKTNGIASLVGPGNSGSDWEVVFGPPLGFFGPIARAIEDAKAIRATNVLEWENRDLPETDEFRVELASRQAEAARVQREETQRREQLAAAQGSTLRLEDLLTGYRVAELGPGRTKLTPRVSARLVNDGTADLRGVLVFAEFFAGESLDPLGNAAIRVTELRPDGGSSTIVLDSNLGYTGSMDGERLLKHSQFKDVVANLTISGAVGTLRRWRVPIQRVMWQ